MHCSLRENCLASSRTKITLAEGLQYPREKSHIMSLDLLLILELGDSLNL